MSEHLFTREQFIGRPVEEVFAFFADAANLERITPPWLRFQIVTPGPIRMRAGAQIDYRLRLRGITVPWKTEITAWDPPHRFVDVQIRGPYRVWVHTHEFHSVSGGTLVRDVVRYALPMGRLGEAIGRWFVSRDVSNIFEYRRAALEKVFNSGTNVDVSRAANRVARRR